MDDRFAKECPAMARSAILSTIQKEIVLHVGNFHMCQTISSEVERARAHGNGLFIPLLRILKLYH